MNKRIFLQSLAASSVLAASGVSFAQTDSFDSLLTQVQSDPAEIEASWAFRDPTVLMRAIGHGTPSQRRISQRAFDLIIAFEVASQSRYEARYTHPIWPRGQSGVTIGIGYDLGYANAATMRRDWGSLLDDTTLATLRPVYRLRGADAQAALPGVQSVTVPWTAALTQFQNYIPYAVAETEGVFSNTADLSEDCRGALVSLVYNRGPSMAEDNPKRLEMRQIRDLMEAKEFTGVPAKLREMKQHWANDPNARGLVTRRELEARLFERGLAA